MRELLFRLQNSPGRVSLAPEVIAIAGYTGRDQTSVRRHVDELAAQGIAPPPRVPMVYAVTPDRLVGDGSIEVAGAHTSGEAEFVLVVVDGEVFVGVGSDHTDRALERLDIAAAKQCCPKVVGPDLWRLADVERHWDRLQLRSWVGSARAPYQDGTVDALMRPADILTLVESSARVPLARATIFCGTLPLLDGHFQSAEQFEAELDDPVLGRRLTCRYTVTPVGWLRAQ